MIFPSVLTEKMEYITLKNSDHYPQKGEGDFVTNLGKTYKKMPLNCPLRGIRVRLIILLIILQQNQTSFCRGNFCFLSYSGNNSLILHQLKAMELETVCINSLLLPLKGTVHEFSETSQQIRFSQNFTLDSVESKGT